MIKQSYHLKIWRMAEEFIMNLSAGKLFKSKSSKKNETSYIPGYSIRKLDGLDGNWNLLIKRNS